MDFLKEFWGLQLNKSPCITSKLLVQPFQRYYCCLGLYKEAQICLNYGVHPLSYALNYVVPCTNSVPHMTLGHRQ